MPDVPILGQVTQLSNSPPNTQPVDAVGLNAIHNALQAKVDQIIAALNDLDAANLGTALSALVVPQPGWIQAIAYDTPDSGWLLCDGSAVSRGGATAALFAKIGTLWGAGDGSTTFNLPDGRGRGLVGKGTKSEINAVGKTEGFAVGSRSPQHTHDLAGHVHNVAALQVVTVNPNFSQVSNVNLTGAASTVQASGHDHTAQTGFNVNSAGPIPNTSDYGWEPYAAVNFQIKT